MCSNCCLAVSPSLHTQCYCFSNINGTELHHKCREDRGHQQYISCELAVLVLVLVMVLVLVLVVLVLAVVVVVVVTVVVVLVMVLAVVVVLAIITVTRQ